MHAVKIWHIIRHADKITIHQLTTVYETPNDPDQLVRGLPARLPDEERVLLPAEDDELNGLAGGPQPRDVVGHAVVQRVLVGVQHEHWWATTT